MQKPSCWLVALLFVVPIHLVSSETSAKLNTKYTIIDPISIPFSESYVINRNGYYLLGPLEDSTVLTDLALKVTSTDSWESSDGSIVQIPALYPYNGHNYIQVLGSRFPEDSYLLLKLKAKATIEDPPTKFLVKSSFVYRKPTDVFRDKLKLGLAGGIQFDTLNASDWKIRGQVSGLIYYKLDIVQEGYGGAKFFLPSSHGPILMPEFAKLSDLVSFTYFERVGYGVGFLDNVVVFACVFDFSSQRLLGVIGLNFPD